MKHILKSAYRVLTPWISAIEPYLNAPLAPRATKPFLSNPLPRIAFVKQEVLMGLYCCEPRADAATLLSSSLKHSGPVSLFTDLGADFWIVKEEMDPECQIWTQSVSELKLSTLEESRALKTNAFAGGRRGHTRAPGEFAVPVDSIDWERYDFVISVDCSIPQRITRRFPKTTWAYLVDHPTMSAYAQSHKAPLPGYDLFLNIRFRGAPLLPRPNAPHEIDWPFNLQRSGCFHAAYGRTHEWNHPRVGIYIESHTEKLLTSEDRVKLESLGPLYFVRPRTEDILFDLMKAKYYIRLGGRPLWGNGMIEAVAAGCLALGDPREYVNRGLFTPRTAVRSWTQLHERLAHFESKRGQADFTDALFEQRRVLDWVCYSRPLQALIAKRTRRK